MAITRIAHIADIHLPPVADSRPVGLSFKQFLGHLSWQRKRRFQHKEEILQRLIKDIKSQSCDHLCICGDMTNLSTKLEYQRATLWLHGIGDARDISIVPGNHDAYHHRFAKMMRLYWSPWMVDKDGMHVGVPFVRQVNDVAIIGVSSAVLTAPFMANGRVTKEQISAVRSILDGLAEEEIKTGRTFYKMMLIHHPPVKGLAGWRRGLHNIEAVHRLIEDYDIRMVLHGHLHGPMCHKLVLGDQTVPILGTASASSNGYRGLPPSQYYMIDIESDQSQNAVYDVKITSRQYNPDKDVYQTVPMS